MEKEKSFKDVPSRKMYNCFIIELQKSYDLQFKDGQNNYSYTDKEIYGLFKPRITIIIGRQREFQSK